MPAHVPVRPACRFAPRLLRGLTGLLAVCAAAWPAAGAMAADDPPTPPTPAIATAPAPAPRAAATQAQIERLQELRAGLADEDQPTREQADKNLRAELNTLLEAVFRVPPDEDTPDQRRQLAQLAAQIAAKVRYEQYLLKIPAAQRDRVDAMLKKSGGVDYENFFSLAGDERSKWLDDLVAAHPDAEALAVFFISLLDSKEPAFVTQIMTAALATAPQVNGAPQAAVAYLESVSDLVKKGYVALYLADRSQPQLLQMRMMAGANGMQEMQAWNEAAINLLIAVPGERAETALLQLLETLIRPEQMQLQMQMGQQTTSMLTTIGEALVERKTQAAFPVILKGVASFNALQMGASFNGGPTMYSSPADQLVYLGYRLLDPKLPRRDPGRFGGLSWQSNAERLRFYDAFIATWQGDNKGPNRAGYGDYEEWYKRNRPQLVNAAEQEAKILEQQGKQVEEENKEY